MSVNAFNAAVAKLRGLAFDVDSKDWDAVDAFLAKEFELERVAKVTGTDERDRLYEMGLLVPKLFLKRIDFLQLSKLSGDAKALLKELKELYGTRLPELIEEWHSVCGAGDLPPPPAAGEESLQEKLFNIDLELPFVNQSALSARSESWCDLCRVLRTNLKAVVSLGQFVVYRCVASATRSIVALEPMWDVVLERVADESEDEGAECAAEEDDDDSSTEAEEDVAVMKDAVMRAMHETAEPEEDEVLQVDDTAGFEKFLDVLDEDLEELRRKRQKMDMMHATAAKTEEEREVAHGRRMRAAKIVSHVLSHFNEVPLAEYSTDEVALLFQGAAGPCYGLLPAIAKYLASGDLRDGAWVKRLKELLAASNGVCRKLVAHLVSLRDSKFDHTNCAVLSYYMCFQNVLAFYRLRATQPSDDSWPQVVSTIAWTAQFCDQLWKRTISVATAAAAITTDDDDTEDAETLKELWSTVVGDSVALHPPRIKCKKCRGAAELQCLKTKSHLEALVLLVIVNGHESKRSSPFRLLKAFQERQMVLPAIVFLHSLTKVAGNKQLTRELLGLALKPEPAAAAAGAAQ